MNNERLKQELNQILLTHNSYLAQISHKNTENRLKIEFKNKDIELNKKYVEMANHFYRVNNLRYHIPSGAWDKLRYS